MGFGDSWTGSGRAAADVPAYPGQVGTRCYTNNFANSKKQANANSLHIAREMMVTMPQISYANWYVSTSDYMEHGSGGTVRFWAKIQYPIGSPWQVVRWNGLDGSPVVADGANSPLSDAGVPLATPIPDGAPFLLHVYADAEVASVISYSSAVDRRTVYDRAAIATSGLADSTTIDTYVSDLTIITPCAIVYPTRKPTCLVIGDSRGFGYGDLIDGAADMGEMARSIGPRFGYINACLYSDRVQRFVASHSRRAALAAYCSHIIGNYGINDVQAGTRTADQVEADIQAVTALFPDKKVFWNTVTPSGDSTDGFVTLSNQTPKAVSQAARIALNDDLRRNLRPSNGTPLGLAGVFDTASVVESSLNSGKFAIGNGGQAITGDGLHLNYVGYAMIANSRAIDLARIAR